MQESRLEKAQQDVEELAAKNSSLIEENHKLQVSRIEFEKSAKCEMDERLVVRSVAGSGTDSTIDEAWLDTRRSIVSSATHYRRRSRVRRRRRHPFCRNTIGSSCLSQRQRLYPIHCPLSSTNRKRTLRSKSYLFPSFAVTLKHLLSSDWRPSTRLIKKNSRVRAPS